MKKNIYESNTSWQIHSQQVLLISSYMLLYVLLTTVLKNLNNISCSFFFCLQLVANTVLFTSVNLSGLFVRILTERAQRKAFLQARNCIEERLRMEDENEKQVWAPARCWNYGKNYICIYLPPPPVFLPPLFFLSHAVSRFDTLFNSVIFHTFLSGTFLIATNTLSYDNFAVFDCINVYLNLLYVYISLFFSPTHLCAPTHMHTHSGAPANESVAQERSYGDERGFPEAPRKDLSQNLHPAPWQCQVGSSHQPNTAVNQWQWYLKSS